MRLRLWRSKSRRPKQRGVAALEFALCTLFLVPLMLGTMDYGYYFYVALNVVGAEQAGLLAAANTVVTDCSGSATAAQVTAKGVAQANARAAETAYLHTNGLDAKVTLITVSASQSPTPVCASTPLNPTWTMTLVADFRPALGRVAPWMKASPTAGYARYTSHVLAMLGN
jgi:Flp pilus assembly protein TadG